MMIRLFFCCIGVYAFAAQAQQTIIIDNNKPRLDNTGKMVDAHDGRMIQFGKKFYWYGTAYGNTNGFTTANEYVCYSSDNLNNWKWEGALLPKKPAGVYYRPHVVYNAKTKKYVLWYNWYPKLWEGQFGVAVSNSPAGPFTILNDNVTVKQQALGVGDLGVFVDDDNKAYLSYNTINGHKVSVELLDDNYTASTLQGSELIAEHCEAGSMFKRNGWYYLLTDYTCCFCTQGSGVKVFTASTPLGPYTYRQNINRYPGVLAPQLNDGIKNDNWFENFNAKEKNAVQIELKQASKVNAITIFQFTGDRNGQCGEVNNPVLHHPIETHQYSITVFSEGEWKPVAFKTTVTKTAMQNKYQFSFEVINATQIKLSPVYTDSNSVLHIEEIWLNSSRENYRVYKTAGNQEGKPIIPAQQTYVMKLNTPKGNQYIWMGDLWGSASDGIKGHDYQFWSAPLQFYKNGLIRLIEWKDKWSISVKN
jgi:hypothetical protein